MIRRPPISTPYATITPYTTLFRSADASRNVVPEGARERLQGALAAGLDAAAFTSSSTVEHLADASATAEVTFPFPGVLAVSIGPITSQTLRGLGWEPAAEAEPHDVPGLIEAVVRVLSIK
jgi:uroporphyrinogen-III synthase